MAGDLPHRGGAVPGEAAGVAADCSDTPVPAAVLAERRDRVMAAIGEKGALILPAAPASHLEGSGRLRYRPDPDLYYLTGITEPETVAVLVPMDHEHAYTLFAQPRDPESERWVGPRGGLDAAREEGQSTAAYALHELEDRLPDLVAGVDTLYFPLGSGCSPLERLVVRIVSEGRKRRQRSGKGPRGIVDPGAVLDDMRLVKDPRELLLLREAARITVEAFREAAAAVGPGVGEWEVEARLEAAFRRRKADGPAFPSIVASGGNAGILHYVQNRRRMQAGEMVLLDAGATWRMYNADVSRTFPVSGSFTAEQRTVYDAVVAARDAAISAVRPGALVSDLQEAALKCLLEGLLEIGALAGPLETLLEDDSSYKEYFPHKVSHWLGLDVHDVGEYARDGRARRLVSGMVLTVEPGLYFPASAPCPVESLRGSGIRVEDNVVVTDQGHEVLTGDLSVAAEAVQEMVG